jgi:hypothetical protein
MQDRYAGDVGDFAKLGLLRHLATSSVVGGTGLSIGVNWYLAPDEGHNADGKHVAYLEPSNRKHVALAACDPYLIGRLAEVVVSGRSVRALEMCGALPSSSLTFGEMLDPAWDSVGRGAWHGRALDVLADADLVFADPDNGLCSLARRPKLLKYALVSELADYARRQQSLVVYHHMDRSAKAAIQALRRLEELASGVDQVPVGAVISRRGSCRFFLVTAAELHRDWLFAALVTFAERWSEHVEVVSSL